MINDPKRRPQVLWLSSHNFLATFGGPWGDVKGVLLRTHQWTLGKCVSLSALHWSSKLLNEWSTSLPSFLPGYNVIPGVFTLNVYVMPLFLGLFLQWLWLLLILGKLNSTKFTPYLLSLNNRFTSSFLPHCRSQREPERLWIRLLRREMTR